MTPSWTTQIAVNHYTLGVIPKSPRFLQRAEGSRAHHHTRPQFIRYPQNPPQAQDDAIMDYTTRVNHYTCVIPKPRAFSSGARDLARTTTPA